MQVTVSTREFKFAHGKAPRGKGGWAFFFDGATAVEQAFWFTGAFAAARTAAVAEAKRRGATTVRVGS